MLDYPTLLGVVMFVSAIAGMLLVFAWLQNRDIHALGIWGAAYVLSTVAMTLLVVNRSAPVAWYPLVAFPVWIAAHGLMWKAARSFEGRRTPISWALAGAALWLIACLIEDFNQSQVARIMLASGIMGVYLLLCASEIWRAQDRDLVSRWPAIILLTLHGVLLLGRVPFVGVLPFPGGVLPPSPHWFPFGLFEMTFHIFCMSFLLVNMAKERAELRQRRNSLIDPLTGVANRRAFFEEGEALLRRAQSEGRSVVLLAFDLDRFKSINDTFGHQVGDKVLARFCDVACAAIRTRDLFGRFGGEEFACLMPDMSLRVAAAIAEDIRTAFSASPIVVGSERIVVTVSVGVAMPNEAGWKLDQLFTTADRALYRAKAKGRNCVQVARAPLHLVEPASAASSRPELVSAAWSA
jgi:diguanylate cyclase (GGDEF)-like protein